ncbi:DUF3560 domain-containing protein [Xanthocytophaga flava]|uniref:DUF3560 domain-containing protein n=1 Tax=Xanthocytophaga flava TaxID=3048013 RepID=UPI0028D73D04|nr:DUF3560 domain-containing protein [Xanthocytophaga flavus]MDJ1470211.1 DUF3560 domain-containing protein [Xanthocytophaga flavus]
MQTGSQQSGYYIKNLESGKIELYFSKSEYKALSTEARKKIKSYFLFSSSKAAWISKSSQNTSWVEEIANSIGLIYKGTEGEKISFGEKVELASQKAASQAERFKNRAIHLENQSNQLFANSHNMVSCIPVGQPILVGHHSEKAHRNLLNRSWTMLGNAVKTSERADYYQQKAKAATYTASQEQLNNPAFLNRRIEECKANIRKQEQNLSNSTSENNKRIYLERIAEQNDKLTFYTDKLIAMGGIKYTKENLKLQRVSHIFYKSKWYPLKSLNTKSVTVINWLDLAGWTWNVPYAEIKGIKTLDQDFKVLDRNNEEVKPTIKYK